MKFSEFITEAKKEGANLHLEHIEDEVLNRGVAGTRDAINFLQSLRDMLAGHSSSKVNVTTQKFCQEFSKRLSNFFPIFECCKNAEFAIT